MQSHRRRRLFRFALCLILAAGCGKVEGEPALVPPDRSLSLAEYEDLGVPRVSKAWSSADQAAAVAALSKLEWAELPRAGSERSGLLFQALLAVRADATKGPSATIPRGPTSPGVALYAAGRIDGYFFDRELAELAVANIRANLGLLDDLAGLGSPLRGPPDPSLHSLSLETGRALLVADLTQLLQILDAEATRPDTRTVVVGSLASLLHSSAKHLDPASLERLAEAIQDLSDLPYNAAVAERLRDVAAREVGP